MGGGGNPSISLNHPHPYRIIQDYSGSDSTQWTSRSLFYISRKGRMLGSRLQIQTPDSEGQDSTCKHFQGKRFPFTGREILIFYNPQMQYLFVLLWWEITSFTLILFTCLFFVFVDAELKGVKQDNQSVLGIRLKFESGLKNLMRFLCLSP